MSLKIRLSTITNHYLLKIFNRRYLTITTHWLDSAHNINIRSNLIGALVKKNEQVNLIRFVTYGIIFTFSILFYLLQCFGIFQFEQFCIKSGLVN